MIHNLEWKIYYVLMAFIVYLSCIKMYFNIKEYDISHITKGVELYNEAQLIQNTELYGNVTNETIIVAIQVHDDVDSLARLITSLSNVHNIEDTLLVFSHEFYSQQMNDIILKIQFAKVLQIFFPYSMQLYEFDFPGDDTLNKYLATRNMTCREAKYTQIKHHWWWKACRIFNQLKCTDKFNGDVAFLEDFHHVSEDFVHMIRLLRATANKECPQCEMLSLSATTEQLIASYVKDALMHLPNIEREPTWSTFDNNFKITQFDFDKTEIIPWRQDVKILGLVFNRTIWNNIMKYRGFFCNYNDYHWEYSLINLSLERPMGPFHVLALKAPRVLYVGKCNATDTEVFGCNATTVDRRIGRIFKSFKPFMFPSTLFVGAMEQTDRPYLTEKYGKFDYEPDHELCIDMSNEIRRYFKDIFNYEYVRKSDEPIFLLD